MELIAEEEAWGPEAARAYDDGYEEGQEAQQLRGLESWYIAGLLAGLGVDRPRDRLGERAWSMGHEMGRLIAAGQRRKK